MEVPVEDGVAAVDQDGVSNLTSSRGF